MFKVWIIEVGLCILGVTNGVFLLAIIMIYSYPCIDCVPTIHNACTHCSSTMRFFLSMKVMSKLHDDANARHMWGVGGGICSMEL